MNKNLINCICDGCGLVFLKSKTLIQSNLKRCRKNCCSNKCKVAVGKGLCKLINFQCLNCDAYTIRKEKDYKRSLNHFCSTKCSAVFHLKKKNPNYISRDMSFEEYLKNPKKCKNCKENILPKNKKNINYMLNRTFCSSYCANYKNKPNTFIMSLGVLTKGFLFKNRKSWQSARTDIRRHAVFIFENNSSQDNCICGYDKHLEVCHLKGVAEFKDSSQLFEINDINNLIKLCPNCHWELDNGLIIIEKY